VPTTNPDSSISISQATREVTEATGNYDTVRFNAMKHGILTQLTVLPHENQGEFADLLAALVEEHQPAGATEAHLIEELASVIWRKRRVLLAEGANLNRGLKSATRDAETLIPSSVPFETGLSGKSTDLRELLRLTSEEVSRRQKEALHDLSATRKAATILERGGTNAYKRALQTLLPDSRDWWQEYVEEEEYPPNNGGLSDFIREQLEPMCVSIEKEAQHHSAIKAQIIGEGLQVHRLEKLNRYETHLDRKFERILAMLVKLKEIRNRKYKT